MLPFKKTRVFIIDGFISENDFYNQIVNTVYKIKTKSGQKWISFLKTMPPIFYSMLMFSNENKVNKNCVHLQNGSCRCILWDKPM